MRTVERLHATVAVTTERVTGALEAARRRWRAVDAVLAARERDRRLVGGALAGAVAFRLFVYLLPLFLASVTLLGLVASLGGNPVPSLGDQLGLSAYLVDSVESAADDSQRGLWALVPLALWATYSAGLATTKVLRAIHALAWDRPVERLQRAWIGAVTCFGVVVLVMAIVAVTQVLRQRSERLGLGFAVAQVVVLVGVWWVVSHALPHAAAARWRALLPGAVLVGVGVWGLHVASALLLARRVASASALYGSLGVAAALLAWLYLLGRLLVGSAMLNATLWERRRRRVAGATQPVPPDRPGPARPAAQGASADDGEA